MGKFSAVIPVKDEVELIRNNLPSWCQLKPDELILCFDKPAPKDCVELAQSISKKHNVKLKILELERNPEYKFHQAWIRREGFKVAKHDKILTGDIDLFVLPSCLKAIKLLGKNDVGLVSLSKLPCTRGFLNKLKNTTETLALRGHKTKLPTFTGLYCIYRPFWLDSESEEGVKKLEHPKFAPLSLNSWGGYIGEDTYLRDCMAKKHKCIYLPDIGAKDHRPALEDVEYIQNKIGRKYAYDNRNLLLVVAHAIIHIRPRVLAGYLSEKIGYYTMKELFGDILYVLIRVILRLLLGKERRDKIFERCFYKINAPSMKSSVHFLLHERPVSLKVKQLHGEVFADVGACYGYYALLLHNNFKKVYAFEPANTAKMLENIKSFGANNISVINKVVCDKDGKDIFFKVTYGSYNPVGPQDTLRGVATNKTVVKCDAVSLSQFFKDESIIDLIKVDVEGSEWKVLEGAEKVMDRIKAWAIELHFPNQKQRLEDHMMKRGYKCEWLSDTHLFAWRD